MRALGVEALSLRGFRNLAAVDVGAGERFNVISGDNGQGKTNLLEAIYVVATSRSFRTAKPGDLVQIGSELASVRARIVEDGMAREQSVGLRAGGRVTRIDGKRPPSLAAYARGTPVVVFHPGELSLSMGGGSERRRLLDRLGLHLRASSLDDLDRYQLAMRERQRALETRGVGAADASHWEELMVRHGVPVLDVRAEATASLAASASASFARIAAPGLALRVEYAPGAPRTPEAFRAALESSRPRDLRRGGAGIGPHRDDVELAINGRPVRGLASQGQHRAAVLALKAAEVDVVRAARGSRPILLLDDVSSELDRGRTSALFAFLSEQLGQVFLTTTRPELIEISPGERCDFRLEAGVVSRV